MDPDGSVREGAGQDRSLPGGEQQVRSERDRCPSVKLFVLREQNAPFHILSSSKYYEKEAVLMDPVDGPILASLLGNYT